MTATTYGPLPYRADAAELLTWVEAQARGRAPAQTRAEGLGGKTLEGVTLTARLLGLAENGVLTSRGRELALADPAARRSLLREAMLSFAPYGELLEELRARGQSTSDALWIEAWWATHGYGGSPSNRQEGVAVLGRLAEYAGMARYIQGRRGHPTRLEWVLGAPGARDTGADSASPPPDRPPSAAADSTSDPAPGPSRPATPAEVNRVRIALEGGLSAQIEVPTRLPRGEKRRLLELLDLLVADE